MGDDVSVGPTGKRRRLGEGIVVALAAAGASDVLVANRTVARAEELAARFAGSSIGLDAVPEVCGVVDVVLTSTGGGVLVTEDSVADRGGLEHQRRRVNVIVYIG